MSTTIFLCGRKLKDGLISIPLCSSAVIFTLKYCGVDNLNLKLVEYPSAGDEVLVGLQNLDGLLVSFASPLQLQDRVRNCSLPVLWNEMDNLIRSGLCCIVRHIVRITHDSKPNEAYNELLGFRGGTLKACAEVSSWTKLCEIEFPEAVEKLIHFFRNYTEHLKSKTKEKGEHTPLNIPVDLVRLEYHFLKPPRIHNDDKMKRCLLQQIKNQNINSGSGDVEMSYNSLQDLGLIGEIQQSHSMLKYKVVSSKYLIPENENQALLGTEQHKTGFDLAGHQHEDFGSEISRCKSSRKHLVSDLLEYLEKLTIRDIHFEHLYVEGIEMTIADLLMFTFIYHLMESVDFHLVFLTDKLPNVFSWFLHMTTLPRIKQTAKLYGFKLEQFEGDRLCTNQSDEQLKVEVIMPLEIETATDKDLNLERRGRSKYRAIKPEVTSALKKIKDYGINPRTGKHPCDPEVHLQWESFPESVHPSQGGLPFNRASKKCQQLENIITAVATIARPGDIIVDFCSGGGHLGIVIAYKLPKCQVYLIENKEESLLLAKSRVDKLKLQNVTLYQCNMDYFLGRFDLGVCLHACGVATDMVLQKCLDNNAAFVICPCCYGAIQCTHHISYPRSHLFRKANISDKDFLTLGHAADQTEVNTALADQGRLCMNLVDTDRSSYAEESGYSVTLCSLKPLNCTTKNNLLIGIPSV